MAAQKAEAAELAQLRRDNKRLKEEVEVLRKASAFLGIIYGCHIARTSRWISLSVGVFRASESLWNSLAAATVDTLPRVVRSLLADADIRSDPSPRPEQSGVVEAQENVSLAERKQDVRIQQGDTTVRELYQDASNS